MESLVLERRRPVSLRLLAVVGTALGLVPGCVGLGSLSPFGDCPPTGVPCQVAAMWSGQIGWVNDCTNNGEPTPGLAGRMYLFGTDIGYPMAADGSAVVELYNETPVAAGGQPVLLETWHFDPATLKLLLKRDPIGWGYTLFLPWSSYSPAITKVLLKLHFETVKGHKLYAQHASLTLCHDKNPPPILTGQSISPPPALARPNQALPGHPVPSHQGMPSYSPPSPTMPNIPMPSHPGPAVPFSVPMPARR